MTDVVIRIFRSEFKVLARLLIKLALAFTVFLLLATAIGQFRANRFPSYHDLVGAFLIAPAACAVLGLIFYAAVIAYPVKVLTNGISCYDSLGRYHTVNWSDISAVGFMQMHGLKYAVINSATLSKPLTLPVWLKDMPEFISLLEAHAGKDHMLVQALREAT